MFYRIVSGTEAREEGIYEDGAFILEDAEDAYDSGTWVVPEAGYAQWFVCHSAALDYVNEQGGRLTPPSTVSELAADFVGQSIEKPEPGEAIDREQLRTQLTAAGDTFSNADVEAVALEIERFCRS